ncbi:hypothetical protein OS493_027202 [Desmophyllum pertusum]|uniref:Major facilitator superfamily (MFS) profile domain-containing protein n=1 Tax=Desmophyllum pertusum TaxID=174260 RepID=A0A9W9ZMB1_9CNID|nr:hypothetical protein OS493_027202 [Desmophyllum pertusum]
MALTVDQVFDKIGSFGRYQRLLLLGCNGLVFLWFGFPVLIMTFLMADPGWKCVANSSECLFNGSLPASNTSRCNIPRSEWTFTDDLTSVATEFDLVCDKAIYATIASSMIFLGFLLGGIVVGPFADKLGRRLTIYVFGFIIGVFSLLTAFPHAYWLFAVFRFIIGFGVGGASIGIYVLVTEMAGVRHRSLIGVSLWYFWTFSLLVLDLLAYLIRDWRKLAIACGVPAIPIVVGWFITRESPRWLVLKGKLMEADVVLKRIAEVNGKEMPNDQLCQPEKQRMGDLRDLFTSKKMAHKTLLSWYIWFVCGMVYYGVYLSTPNVGGNLYLNFFLTSVIEVFCLPLIVWSSDRFGRKKVIVGSLIFAALSSVGAVLFTTEDNSDKGMLAGRIIFSMIFAKVFITITFDLAYVYSAELFPTVIRNIGMGTSTGAARIGAFCSPYIVYLATVHRLLPYAIMGGNALLCGLLCLTLPETANQPTLETIDSQTPTTTSVNEVKEDSNRNINEEEKAALVPGEVLHLSNV